MEGIFQVVDGFFPMMALGHAVINEGGPCLDGWVYVTEVPFVGGHLTVGMQVALTQHEIKLGGSEVRVHKGERDGMKGEIPGSKPWIFPFVGHGNDVSAGHMKPLTVAD